MRPVMVLVTGLQGTGKSMVADSVGELIDGSVLGHDWAMSGLRPYPSLQRALDTMEQRGRREVGWSVVGALARAELRRGRSVVLDGMAANRDIERLGQAASDEGAKFVLVLTECTDAEIHRSRIEGRRRAIPNWYELDWEHVQRSRRDWDRPDHVDLTVPATGAPEANRVLLAKWLTEMGDI